MRQTPGTMRLLFIILILSGGKMALMDSVKPTELPPYVTTHLLTAVLSTDFIDVNDNGPDINDVGNYVKIQLHLRCNSQLENTLAKRIKLLSIKPFSATLRIIKQVMCLAKKNNTTSIPLKAKWKSLNFTMMLIPGRMD